MPEIIKTTGDYKRLLSYQKADVIYRITFFFCRTFLEKGDRTVDQMIQAAARENRISSKDVQPRLPRRRPK